ncbi:GNAT family N-acetyltransferase [Ulvibacterium sp.]|uniref:GNAT family N-acetyltransferase n=1 Tax=Ulvibacterium sp. TaxID=2665914 RepID=UPI003BAA4A49
MENFHLKTDRLHLIPFTPRDAKMFQQLNNDPFIRKYLWDDELIDETTALELMEQNKKHFEENGYGLWKIRLKQSLETFGYVGLWSFFDEPQPQLIYALLEPYSKQGYATEAGGSIVDYAFDRLGFDYLIAATDEPHLESQKVAQRLGMSFAEKRIENEKPTLFYRIDKR